MALISSLLRQEKLNLGDQVRDAATCYWTHDHRKRRFALFHHHQLESKHLIVTRVPGVVSPAGGYRR